MDAADRAALQRPRTDWNEARVAFLARRWADGASASVIALELGCVSRSAVLGKIFRLKLNQPDTKLRRIRENATPIDHASAGKAFGTPCGLLELSARTCRWPVGDPGDPDFAFCGAATLAPYPYCIGHCLIAYRADDAPADAATPNIPRLIRRAA